MKRIHLALLGITFAIAGGQVWAGTNIVYSDDYDNFSQLSGSFGGAVAAMDDETDSRTVLADNGASTFVETQANVGPLQLSSNPDNLESFTVDTVLRLNDPVAYPPKTIFFDLRNETTPDAPGVFQRLTSAYNSQTGNFTVDEYDQTDKLLQNHFTGVLSPLLPKTDNASDYSTIRFTFDYATSRWSVSSIIGGTTNSIGSSFTLQSSSAVFDKLRYRFEATTGSGNSAYFIDSSLICSTASTSPPPPGIVITTGVVDNVMTVTFDSENGKDYQLECTTNNVDWTAANFTLHGLGQTENTFAPTGSESEKKYRVVTLP